MSQNIPVSYTDPDYQGATWLGVRNVNLAPWDIDYLQVMGPDGTIYPYNGNVWYFYMCMWYECWSPGPFPTPDGAYTFEVKDKAANTYTATTDHTYAYVAPISEASRLPADNAYFYTKTPTFSWAPPGPGTFYYSLHIYDYSGRVHWYASPVITETVFTLPEAFAENAPFGSYKWQVRAYNGDPVFDNMNVAISSRRTFTINATIPTVSTTTPSTITQTSAQSGGNVTSDGGVSVTARGVCWSTSTNPTTADSHTSDGTETGTFTSSITGLNPGTTYHVRAYATNSAGTAFGDEEIFTTLSPIDPGTFYVNIQNGNDLNDGSFGQPLENAALCH